MAVSSTNKLFTLQMNKLHKCLVFDLHSLKMSAKLKLLCPKHYSKHRHPLHGTKKGCVMGNAHFNFVVKMENCALICINPLVNWVQNKMGTIQS